jgi:multicomponent Na+:H+ antiporter subunit A
MAVDPQRSIASAPGQRVATGLGAVLALAAVTLGLLFLPRIVEGGSTRIAVSWVPALGIDLAFMADGLSLVFVLLIGGIGAFVFPYAGAYLRGHDLGTRSAAILIIFMMAMLGVVLADDLILLFVFWELTTITSFLLIGFSHREAGARRSALQGLLVTGAGGLAMLAGFLLIGEAVGSYRISEIIAAGDQLRAHAHYPAILALVLLGVFTKSAQFPFHFWLPNAMAAPTPVSAYLHSATMVKAGVYLLARLHPALADTNAWLVALTVAGGVTAVHAALQALRQTDLKLGLAYTTLVALGLTTMFLGAETPVAMVAALTFVIVHALYKSSLFLVIGNVDHACGTRDLRRLAGLAAAMPATAVACVLAALSMAGFPPFLGFISKELKYEGALAIYEEPGLAVASVLIANALVAALAGILVLRVFLGRREKAPRPTHEVEFTMWIGPVVLASLGLVLGLAPGLIGKPLIQAAVTAMLGRPEPVKLALWHGLNVPLALSVATFVVGATLFLLHHHYVSVSARLARILRLDADRAYDAVLNGLQALARGQTRLIQGTSLNRWMAIVFAVVTVGLAGLLIGGRVALEPSRAGISALDVALSLLVIGGAVATVAARTRLQAICSLGVTGVAIAMLFLVYGAIDVAMTQLIVETLVLVIVALVMPRLSKLGDVPRRGRWRSLRDGLLAVGLGAVAALATHAAFRGPLDRDLTTFFEENSVAGGFGRNIVNVILVDFRALDTLGEVAVVVMAALAGLGLLRGLRRGGAA